MWSLEWVKHPMRPTVNYPFLALSKQRAVFQEWVQSRIELARLICYTNVSYIFRKYLVQKELMMSLIELLTIAGALIGLAAFRFGVPMLVMWLFSQVCCRLNPPQPA